MQGFDTPIKRAREALYLLYQELAKAYIDIRNLKYGIAITIKVSDDKWGRAYPANCIATSLTCHAEIQGELPAAPQGAAARK